MGSRHLTFGVLTARPHTAFHQGTYCQACEHVGRPVRQNNDPCCSNEAAKCPSDRRGLWIGPGDGGSDRAYMHGMPRRKSIVGLARTRYAPSRPMNHASIRPFLVDEPLQQMRQDGGHYHAQSQMIGLAALTIVARARS